jgi:hypothetical protein
MRIQIDTKFSIGDTIFFIKDNEITFGVLYKMDITTDGNQHSIYLYAKDNNDHVLVIPEARAFTSKEQLIHSL